MRIEANGIAIEVEDSGGDRPCVLLIMGLGMQLVAWPPELVLTLIDAGYRVLRFDNRDSGLSHHFSEAGAPNIVWESLRQKIGWPGKPAYQLHDLAQDTIGLLDVLRIERAHMLGVSMGGMIAQRVALAAPGRVSSLVSVMSSSGAPDLPMPDKQVLQALLPRAPRPGLLAVLERQLELLQLIGSPGHPMPAALLRERTALALTRNHDAAGIQRQMFAVLSDTKRAAELAAIRAPTLVLHGRADPLVPFAHGEDTARRIPGARLVGIDGMGHDLSPGVVARLTPLLIEFFAQASTRQT